MKNVTISNGVTHNIPADLRKALIVDESALETGMGLMAWMAVKELAD